MNRSSHVRVIMHLVNTRTRELHTFIDAESAPRYAILSHRWGAQEVSYKDFRKRRMRGTEGYRKIMDSCRFARAHGVDWIWIDTCCIDKRSSAELTEAINSMFRWYARAKVCYAYLADVKGLQRQSDGKEGLMREFEKSTWFRRGWTLQELIAPREVIFLCDDWTIIGSKRPMGSHSYHHAVEANLNETISDITGILKEIMSNRGKMYSTSVAQRMSWAARRSTTRVEDMAYCMLGLFGINMPLVYGEGRSAFARLQAAIISSINDETVFAWTTWDTAPGPEYVSGILASLPAEFAHAGCVSGQQLHSRPPFRLTNGSIEIRIPSGVNAGAYRDRRVNSDKILLELNCSSGVDQVHPHDEATASSTITLVRLSCGHYGRNHERIPPLGSRVFSRDWVRFDADVEEALFVHCSRADHLNCWNTRG